MRRERSGRLDSREDTEERMDAWRRGWRAEGMIDPAEWVGGDRRLKSIELSGVEGDEGDMPSTGGTSEPMAVKRPDGAGGIGAPGTSVGDHG